MYKNYTGRIKILFFPLMCALMALKTTPITNYPPPFEKLSPENFGLTRTPDNSGEQQLRSNTPTPLTTARGEVIGMAYGIQIQICPANA